jgi:hypothetical protein
MRPFTSAELRSNPVDVAVPRGGKAGGFQWQEIPASATLWYNSNFAYGWNDGAVWRGRGATVAAEGGVVAQWRFLTATVDPIVFVSENRAFPLMGGDRTTVSPYSDPLAPRNIDRPQRFGPDAYGVVSPGQSSFRAEALGLTAGVSTANFWIGPMSEWPLILGNNASGFPHAFMGSSHPWNIGIGKIHGRVFYGTLGQSAYSNAPDSISRRLTSGAIGVFQPAMLPGLEIGAIRMFLYARPKSGFGWGDFRKPFEAFLKEHVTGDPGATFNSSADNQLASAFARWVFPGSGLEFYGEYARDDHNWNGRDAILDPDHSAMYGFGLRKAWKRGTSLNGLRAEVVSLDPSTQARERGQGSKYAHSKELQGHTELGQTLGVGFGALNGAGEMLAYDRFSSPREFTSVSVSRMVMRERVAAPSIDAMYSVGVERVRLFRGIPIRTGITGVLELNRYFSSDVGNILLTFGAGGS